VSQVATVCFVQFQWLSILQCRKLRRYLYNIISFGYQIVFICCFVVGVSRKIVSIKIVVLVLFMPIAGVLKAIQRVGCAGVWWIINEIKRAVWTGSCFVPPMRTKGEHYYHEVLSYYYLTIMHLYEGVCIRFAHWVWFLWSRVKTQTQWGKWYAITRRNWRVTLLFNGLTVASCDNGQRKHYFSAKLTTHWRPTVISRGYGMGHHGGIAYYVCRNTQIRKLEC